MFQKTDRTRLLSLQKSRQPALRIDQAVKWSKPVTALYCPVKCTGSSQDELSNSVSSRLTMRQCTAASLQTDHAETLRTMRFTEERSVYANV